MKTLLSIASVLVLAAAPAMAADGHVSQKSLAKMGLSGMQVMTDSQGMSVRGTSIAVVSGSSFSFIEGEGGVAGSHNSYFAAGHHSANGTNVSFAASGDVTVKGDDVKVNAGFVVAGGASSAHAH